MGIKDNPVIYLTRKVWHYSKGNRHMMALYFVLFLFAQTVDFLYPLLLAIIQVQGITNTSVKPLLFYLSFFITFQIIFWACWWPGRVIERANSFIVRAKYKKFLLDGTMNLPAQWHTDHHSGDTIDKIEKGTQALSRYASETFDVVESIVRFVGSYIALAYFNLHSSYIIVFMVIISLTIIFKFDKQLIKQYKKLNKAENAISAKVYDVISNITTVIILRIEKLVSNSIFKKIMSPFTLFKKNIRLNETKWMIVAFCTGIMTFLVLATYVFSALKSGSVVLVGTMAALYAYTDRISDLFFRFAWKYGKIVQQRAAVMNAEEISSEFKDKKRSRKLSPDWKNLKIESLNFSYHTEDGADLHLDNILLTMNRGERIALIGDSGSGKTTLLKVIRELYTPNQVNLYVDGKLLKKGFNSISSSIALIPQDPEIFSTTIKENITLGVRHTISEITKYTDLACFSQVVKRLPNKLNSSIVEKGVNLSGGEKQRLALSRGLMASKDKDIILLDEPTSSVDSKNELKIYENFFREFRGKTIISSIHRLHLLLMFDKIYFFKEGKIIASGSFNELLKKSTEFRFLWNKYKAKVRN